MASTTQELLAEKQNGTVLKSLLSTLTKPIVEATKEMRKAEDDFKEFFKRNSAQNKNVQDILSDNFAEMKKLAEAGNESAQLFVDEYQKHAKTLEDLTAKQIKGQDLTDQEIKYMSKTTNNLFSLAKESGKTMEVNLNKMVNRLIEIAKDGSLSLAQRREQVKYTQELLEGQKSEKNLTASGLDVLEELHKLFQSDLGPAQVKSLEDIAQGIGDLRNVTIAKVSAPMGDLEHKLSDFLLSQKEIQHASKHYNDQVKDREEDNEKEGIITKEVKAGAVEALLAQFGLGGLGIGGFITDPKKMKETWQNAVTNVAKFSNGVKAAYKFITNFPANAMDLLGKAFKPITNIISSAMRSILTPISANIEKAWKSIKKKNDEMLETVDGVVHSLKNVGSNILETLQKTTSGVKKMLSNTFQALTDGFGDFWKSGLELMGKGGGLIGEIFSIAMTALMGLFGGGGIGGMAMGGIKALGTGAMALGRGALNVGKGAVNLLGKGASALGVGGSAAAGGLLSGAMVGYGAYTDYQNAKANGASPEELRKLKGQGVSKTIGATAGGAAGAALGTLLLPGVGTAIGGYLGSLGGEWLGEHLWDYLDGGGAAKIMEVVNKGLDFMFGKDGIFVKVGDFFKGVLEKFTWGNIKGVLSSLGDAMMDLFNIKQIKAAIDGVMQAGKGMFTSDSVLDGIKNFISSIFDVIKQVLIGFVPGAGLAKEAGEWLSKFNPFSSSPEGTSATSSVTAPGLTDAGGAASAALQVQKATPTAMGNVASLDSSKAKSLATNDMIQAAQSSSSLASEPAPISIPPSGGSGIRGGGYKSTQIDDLGLATLNSILFE